MDSGEYAYHVTYARNLSQIVHEGLDPAMSTGLSAPGYVGHSRGKTFFTDYDGIGHWYWVAENAANDQSDNAFKDRMVPVILAFPWPAKFFEDEAVDTESEAFYTKDPIDPDDILMWDGSMWLELDDEDSVDLSQAFDFEDTWEGVLAWFKPIEENKLADAEEICWEQDDD